MVSIAPMGAYFSAVRAIFSHFLDLLAPPRESERVVRALSLDELFMLEQDEALPYHDARVRALVWEIKYYANARALALAATILRERLRAIYEESAGVPRLIPMPMHHLRRKARGHNQTELLCEALLRDPDIAAAFVYTPNALIRIKHTAPQQGLPEHQRRHNVEDTMQVVDVASVAGCVCVVVDDVATTGATLREATRALTEAGAREVITISLAQS